MTIFSLLGEILIKDNGAKKTLEDVNSAGEKTSSGLTGAFGKIGSAALKVGAMVGIGFGFKEAISGAYKLAESASDLNEAQNVVEQTFGKTAKSIEQWTTTTEKSAGISQTASTQWAGFMGAMLKSSGVSQTASASMSKNLVQLTGDMSSFYNVSTSDMWEKIRSGISGETEPLKEIGINMSVANLQAYALAEGIKKPYAQMSQGEQTMLRYNYLMSVTKDAQGDFGRTLSTSFANQMRVAQMNLADLGRSVGTMLLPAFNDAVSWFNNHMPQIKQAISNMINGAESAIKTLAPVVSAGFGSFKQIMDWIVQHSELVKAAIAGIGTAFASLKAASSMSNIFKAFTDGAAGVKTATGLVSNFGRAFTNIKSGEGIIKGISTAFGIANPTILIVVASITAVAMAATLVTTHWAQVRTFFTGFWNSTKTIFNNIKTTVTSTLNSVKTTITNVLSTAVSSVKNTLNGLNSTLQQHQTAIKVTAGILGTIFGPALIKSGVQAVAAGAQIAASFIANIVQTGIKATISGAQITASFVASMITTGAQAVVNGAQVTASFITSMITAGAQATVNGAKIVGSFVASLITTAAQAITTGGAITGNLIVAVVSYAADGWKAVASITAQTAAWIAQKAGIVASTAALIASKVATIASTGATTALTAAQWLLNAALNANPIGIVITLLAGLAAVLITAYNKSSTFRNGVNGAFNAVKDGAGIAVNWIKDKVHELANLPGEALKWGQDMLDGFINGIKSKIGAIGNAVSNVASTIRSFLHFSVPDEGPLTDYESWMPDFMQGLAKGIDGNIDVVNNSLIKLSSVMANAVMPERTTRSSIFNSLAKGTETFDTAILKLTADNDKLGISTGNSQTDLRNMLGQMTNLSTMATIASNEYTKLGKSIGWTDSKTLDALKNYQDYQKQYLETAQKVADAEQKISDNKYDEAYEKIDAAVKSLTGDTDDLDLKLSNQQQALKDLNFKAEGLNDQYKELVKTYGQFSDQAKDAAKAIDYNNQAIQDMNSSIAETQQKMEETSESDLNSLFDKLKSALKDYYDDEEKQDEAYWQSKIDANSKWKEDTLSNLETVYNAQKEAIEKQKTLLDRQNSDEDDADKIAADKKILNMNYSAKAKADAQADLNSILKEQNRRHQSEQLDDQETALENQYNSNKDNIEKVAQANEDYYNSQIDSIKAFYEDKEKEANLDAEAQKMIVSNNQDEMVKLLKSYGEDYEVTGASLGERLVAGFKQQMYNVQDIFDATVRNMDSIVNKITSTPSVAVNAAYAGGYGGYSSSNGANTMQQASVSNTYGSLLHADTIVLNNSKDVQQTAEELEFYRQQAARSKGGK